MYWRHCIAEGLDIWHKVATWITLTRRWTKAFAQLFAIGTVSGTILSFEIDLLWPTFTKFSGSIIGLQFALEGFAFIIEAIFLGLHLYSWSVSHRALAVLVCPCSIRLTTCCHTLSHCCLT